MNEIQPKTDTKNKGLWWPIVALLANFVFGLEFLIGETSKCTVRWGMRDRTILARTSEQWRRNIRIVPSLSKQTCSVSYRYVLRTHIDMYLCMCYHIQHTLLILHHRTDHLFRSLFSEWYKLWFNWSAIKITCFNFLTTARSTFMNVEIWNCPEDGEKQWNKMTDI